MRIGCCLASSVLCLGLGVLSPESARSQGVGESVEGLRIERLMEDGGDVFLVKIDTARQGTPGAVCEYDYTASTLDAYRWQGDTAPNQWPERIKFSSTEGFRINDLVLVLRNHRSDKLNPNQQDSCRKQMDERMGGESLLLRWDELVPVFKLDDKHYALLGRRQFSSGQPKVFSRETKVVGPGKYAMLAFAGGRSDGDFVLLEDLLKPLAEAKQPPPRKE